MQYTMLIAHCVKAASEMMNVLLFGFRGGCFHRLDNLLYIYILYGVSFGGVSNLAPLN